MNLLWFNDRPLATDLSAVAAPARNSPEPLAMSSLATR